MHGVSSFWYSFGSIWLYTIDGLYKKWNEFNWNELLMVARCWHRLCKIYSISKQKVDCNIKTNGQAKKSIDLGLYYCHFLFSNNNYFCFWRREPAFDRCTCGIHTSIDLWLEMKIWLVVWLFEARRIIGEKCNKNNQNNFYFPS